MSRRGVEAPLSSGMFFCVYLLASGISSSGITHLGGGSVTEFGSRFPYLYEYNITVNRDKLAINDYIFPS